MLRIGASSGTQVLRTIAGIPSGPLDLEVSSWRRVWRTFRVENLVVDIFNFELEEEPELFLSCGKDNGQAIGRQCCL